MRYAIPLVLIFLLAIPWPGIFCALRVTHLQSGQVLLTFPFFFRQTFYLSYTHSIYKAPVVEKFEAAGSAIRLREISTKSWGVVDYYNISGILRQERGEIKIQDINFKLPKLLLMTGFTGEQRLTLENRTYALSHMGEPGTILNVEVPDLPPWRYLWERAIRLGNADWGLRNKESEIRNP